MKSSSKLVKTLCEIGIFAALGFVFDELQGILFKGVFPDGGSIGIAMIAVLIIAYRRGLLAGFLTGLIMGLLDVATSAYIIHPIQLMLDYVIPYALVGLAGLIRPLLYKHEDKKSRILLLIAGTFIGGLAKFLSHYAAGVFFWFDPDGFKWGLTYMSAYLYSFVYNIAFIGPSIVLTGALLIALYLRAPQVVILKKELQNKSLTDQIEESEQIEQKEPEKEENKNPFPLVLSIATAAFATFVFVFYLIKYINSYSDYIDGNAFGYDFDPDSMLIFVLGLFLMIMGVNNIFKYFKNKFSYLAYSGVLATLLLVSFIYDISRIVRMYNDREDPTLYWIWFVIGLLSLAGGIVFFVISLIKSRKKKQS